MSDNPQFNEAETNAAEESNLRLMPDVTDGGEKDTTKEKEAEQTRDLDARIAEDALRIARDDDARSQIQTSINNIVLQAELEIAAKIDSLLQRSSSQIDTLINVAKSDIETRGLITTNDLMNDLRKSGQNKIDELLALLDEQIVMRSIDATETESAARIKREQHFAVETDTVIKNITQEFQEKVAKMLEAQKLSSVNRIVETVEQGTTTLQEVQQLQIDTINSWAQRIAEKQKEFLAANSPMKGLELQHAIIADTVDTTFKMYSTMFAIGSQFIKRLSSQPTYPSVR